MGQNLEIETARHVAPEPVGPCRWEFPDPESGGAEGLTGFGADLEPSTLIHAYRHGIFPWPHGPGLIPWVSPDPRAIIPVESLHISRRLQRTLRQGRFRFTVDASFAEVIAACADRAEGSWITPAMVAAYRRLHELGWAHSVEAWTTDGELAGGVYGVSIGHVFAAESMFHRRRDASKAALAALVDWAASKGVTMIDVQLLTPHLAALGAIEIPRQEYLRRLPEAVE